ncbi:MAG: hypothetical protein ACLGH8_00500 [Bacteroidia bacterium]
MIRTVVITLSVLYTTVSFGQQTKSNQMDAQGKRHGQWKGMYEGTKHPRFEGTFNHGKETGTFKFYTNTDKPILKATRVFAADGSCLTTFFDEKGAKVSEGREVNHKQDGEWKYYHQGGGKIMAVEMYKDGKLNGFRKVFFTNGAVTEECNYVNGLKQGVYKKYNEKGVVLEESNFTDGVYNGPAVFRDDYGNKGSEGLYKNDLKVGVWKIYDGGKLIKEENMDAKKRPSAVKE